MLWSSTLHLLAIMSSAVSFEQPSRYVTSHRPVLARFLFSLARPPVSRRFRNGAKTVPLQRRAMVGEGARRLTADAWKPAQPEVSDMLKTEVPLQSGDLVREGAYGSTAGVSTPAKFEVDQALMLATLSSGAVLAAVWLSAMGGEYWTAASRSAVVAMVRTMGADYATQLGKHKLGLAGSSDSQDSDVGSVADEFRPDLNRTFSMGLFYELYYIGPFSYVLTELYPRWFGNDGTWQEVWSKVLVENVLWMPIGYWLLWSLFKVSIDSYLERGQQVINGTSEQGVVGNLAEAIWRDVTTDFWKKNRASFMFWGPADIFNFKFVDQYYVPTAMVFEGAIWAAILGTIEYDQKKAGATHDNISSK